jgi:hypothetical protein
MNITALNEVRIEGNLETGKTITEFPGIKDSRFVPVRIYWWAANLGGPIVSGIHLSGEPAGRRVPSVELTRTQAQGVWPEPPGGWAALEAVIKQPAEVTL